MGVNGIEQESYYRIASQDCFVDMSSCFRCNCGKCINIFGPRMTGKSTLLSALRCYYNEKYDSKDLFDHCAYGEHCPDHWEKNKHPVLNLDFSDYAATTMTGAVQFFKVKMSALYIEHMECMDECWSYNDYEFFLNVIEGKTTRQDLQRSLLKLVHLLRWFGKRRERALILIDEAGRPLLYAAKYGYLDRLMSFYDAFLEIDHYELTYGIITTSYAPPDTDVPYSLKYIHNEPINIIEPCRSIARQNGMEPGKVREDGCFFSGRKYFHQQISLEECFDEMMKQDGEPITTDNEHTISLDDEMMAFITEKRFWISKSMREAAIAKRKQKIQSRKEYAAPLPEDCVIPSEFAGIRELNIQIRNQDRFEQLNSQLVAMYDQYGKEISQHRIYEIIQGIEKEGNGFPDGYLTELKKHAEEQKMCHNVHLLSDENWIRFDVARHKEEPGYSDLALVKSYLSVADDMDSKDVFQQVVSFLIDYGEHRFHAKIAKRKRADHICLWTAREDFFPLEEFVRESNFHLITPLPFVAYRGNIGISREMYSWNSYNGILSEMIRNYLGMIEQREQISLLDMYALYVRAWNGELEEEHPFSKEYKQADAQELLILLESLNVLLGHGIITDDHLLLNGEQKLWYELGRAKNWYEVGEKLINWPCNTANGE